VLAAGDRVSEMRIENEVFALDKNSGSVACNMIFEEHHQPLCTWVVGLYLMGLNLSNEQIAQNLDL